MILFEIVPFQNASEILLNQPTRWRIFVVLPVILGLFGGVILLQKFRLEFVHVHSNLYSAFRLRSLCYAKTATLTNDLECCTHKPRLDSLHAIQRRVNNATRLKKTQNYEWTKYPGGANNRLQIHFTQPVPRKTWILDLFKMIRYK